MRRGRCGTLTTPATPRHKFPLTQVTLIDAALALVDEWTGYLVPRYLSGLPNVDAGAPYRLIVDGVELLVAPGDLEVECWRALIAYDDEFRSRGWKAS